MTAKSLTPAQWRDLYAGLRISAERYGLSFDSHRMAAQSAKDRPIQAFRCYSAILRSFGPAK